MSSELERLRVENAYLRARLNEHLALAEGMEQQVELIAELQATIDRLGGKVEPSDELITAEVAADIIGCSRRTILRWVDSGKLAEAMQLPGATGAMLFRRADVEALDGELQAERGWFMR